LAVGIGCARGLLSTCCGDGAAGRALNQGKVADGGGVYEALQLGAQISRDVGNGLSGGEEASSRGVGEASGVTRLAIIPGVKFPHMSFVAVLTPGRSGESDEGKCAVSFEIFGRGTSVGLIGKADKTVSCLQKDCGGEAFEGFVGEGGRGSGRGTCLTGNDTDGAIGGSVVRQGKVKRNVYLVGARGNAVATGVVRMKRLEMDGLLVQHFPPALVDNVLSGNVVLLEFLDEGPQIGVKK
jgi:hypothetical protein